VSAGPRLVYAPKDQRTAERRCAEHPLVRAARRLAVENPEAAGAIEQLIVNFLERCGCPAE
jgi:hypothetical protein